MIEVALGFMYIAIGSGLGTFVSRAMLSDTYNPEATDYGLMGVAFIMSVIFWPLAVFMATVVALGYLSSGAAVRDIKKRREYKSLPATQARLEREVLNPSPSDCYYTG